MCLQSIRRFWDWQVCSKGRCQTFKWQSEQCQHINWQRMKLRPLTRLQILYNGEASNGFELWHVVTILIPLLSLLWIVMDCHGLLKSAISPSSNVRAAYAAWTSKDCLLCLEDPENHADRIQFAFESLRRPKTYKTSLRKKGTWSV